MDITTLSTNTDDFLQCNPVVTKAIKSQPGEVSFQIGSWAIARAREHGIEFADEKNAEENDQCADVNDAKFKVVAFPATEASWDVEDSSLQASANDLYDTDKQELYLKQEDFIPADEIEELKNEDVITITDSEDYDDDEEDYS